MTKNKDEILNFMFKHMPLGHILSEHGHMINEIHGLEENGPMGFCYHNALTKATEEPERYVYFEGMVNYIVPMCHAWLYDKIEQKFVDPTWGAGQHVYVGIPFHNEDLHFLLEKTDMYSFFDNHLVMRMQRNEDPIFKSILQRSLTLQKSIEHQQTMSLTS